MISTVSKRHSREVRPTILKNVDDKEIFETFNKSNIETHVQETVRTPLKRGTSAEK